MKDKFTILFGEISFLHSIGHDFLSSAIEIYQGTSRCGGEFLHSFDLLAVHGLENILKSLIALNICLKNLEKNECCIRNLIEKEFHDVGHNIKQAFEKNTSLKTDLKISEICRELGVLGFIDEFRIHFEQKTAIFKYTEGTRYGAFARNKNYGTKWNNDTFEFLTNFKEKAWQFYSNLATELKSVK